MKKNIIQSLGTIMVIPLIMSLIGSVLLFVVAFIPNEWLLDNSFQSALELRKEFDGEFSVSHSPASREVYSQDIYTDSIIIESSYTMGESIDNVLLNRIVPGGARPVRLLELLEGLDEADQSYSRYWMGFRTIVRPLLMFMSYYDIRALAGTMVFLLLVAAVAALAKRGKALLGLALAMSFCFVEPWAVCSSLQFSSCFAIMYAFVILLNCADINLEDESAFISFCVFGALTQFFDFYTYPLVVFAVPCAVLVWGYRGKRLFALVLKLFGAWFVSWLVMWGYKQVAAALVSGGTELVATIESVAFRFGMGEYKDPSVSYSVKEAFYRVWYYISDFSLKWTMLVIAVLISGLFTFSRLKYGKNQRLYVYIAIAALPLVWMAATAQPIYIHYWFQYRSLYISIFALFIYTFEALGLSQKDSSVIKYLWKN